MRGIILEFKIPDMFSLEQEKTMFFSDERAKFIMSRHGDDVKVFASPANMVNVLGEAKVMVCVTLEDEAEYAEYLFMSETQP